MTRVVSVVGARPQFVKLAAIADAARRRPDIEHRIIHTGQHYDDALSDIFFRELDIPAPDTHLDIGSGTHGVQTGAMLAALDPILSQAQPDCVLVYGDTNTTLAATLAAVKMHLFVAHLESGLRSFNRAMPEEHNRVLVDHAADLLLAPTPAAVDHLRNEGLGERSVLIGDVMTDILHLVRDRAATQQSDRPRGAEHAQTYVVATIHRAENTDEPERLRAVIDSLRAIETPVLLIAHPRLRSRADRFGISLDGGSLYLTQPLGYPQMVQTLMSSAGVVTDSGGLQKEAFLLGVPCTTLRHETEWPETLTGGWNVLVDDLHDVVAHVSRPAPDSPRGHPYGDGRAAERALDAISGMA